jgi:putative transposase
MFISCRFRKGMKKQQLKLKSSDEAYLQGLLAKGSLTAKVFKRATALLEINRGKPFAAIAETLDVCYQSISTWCAAFNKEGLSMLHDNPRCGRPIKIDGAQRAKITALACSEAPEGHSKWSLRLLADKVVELGYCEHLSHDYAGEILKKTKLNRT